MKVGIAYNIFDGEEILPFSLINMSMCADYICVVYQTTSNFGNENPNLEDQLIEYKNRGLIDELYKYEPILNSNPSLINTTPLENGLKNEIVKRNLGLELCRRQNCDLFMTIDCDEIYPADKFGEAKKEFLTGGYDTSFCQMKTFYKRPDLQVVPNETYYVPFICRLKNNTRFSFDYWNSDYPVQTDPTRRVKAGYSRVFSRDELEMYHYAYVRNCLKSKVENTSSQVSEQEKNRVVKHFEDWYSIDDGALFLGGNRFELKETTNYFNIQL